MARLAVQILYLAEPQKVVPELAPLVLELLYVFRELDLLQRLQPQPRHVLEGQNLSQCTDCPASDLPLCWGAYDFVASKRNAIRETSFNLDFRTTVFVARAVLSSIAVAIEKSWAAQARICSTGPDFMTSHNTWSIPIVYEGI